MLARDVDEMKSAGIDITLSDHMLVDLWKKFVLLSGTSGITASTRQPLGVIRDDEDMRAFFFKLMHETMAVGRAAGVELPQTLRPSSTLGRNVSADHESLDGKRP